MKKENNNIQTIEPILSKKSDSILVEKIEELKDIIHYDFIVLDNFHQLKPSVEELDKRRKREIKRKNNKNTFLENCNE